VKDGTLGFALYFKQGVYPLGVKLTIGKEDNPLRMESYHEATCNPKRDNLEVKYEVLLGL
jgi:hypothetical protein